MILPHLQSGVVADGMRLLAAFHSFALPDSWHPEFINYKVYAYFNYGSSLISITFNFRFKIIFFSSRTAFACCSLRRRSDSESNSIWKGKRKLGKFIQPFLAKALGPNMFLCISCLSADHECPFAFVRPNGPWILQQRHESGPWIDGQFNHQNHLGPLQGVINSSQTFAYPPQIHTCLFHSFWVA